MSSKAALKELRANAGTQFNPVVVEAFIATVEVRGEVAVQESTQIFEQALAAVRARA
jgi:HD-GYP domain-containing protein (c-di-GMP phosphodiesterase class II)